MSGGSKLASLHRLYAVGRTSTQLFNRRATNFLRGSKQLTSTSDGIEDSPSLRRQRLEGKVTLITGGATGIGAVTAKLFALHGSKIVVADLQEESGRQVAEEIGASTAAFLKCDATDEEQLAAVVDAAVSRFGRLDVLVNTVGGVPGKPGIPVEQVEQKDFESTWALNVGSQVMAIKHAARVMIPLRRGSIICFSSTAGVISISNAGFSYSLTKLAVNGLAKLAACDLDRYGIRVNSIAPAGVLTERFLRAVSNKVERSVSMEELKEATAQATEFKGNPLEAIDVAETALFLASDESEYMSGQTLILDGAFSNKKEWRGFNVMQSLATSPP